MAFHFSLSFKGMGKGKSSLFSFGSDARRDWFVILVFFLAINLLSLIGNVRIYERVSKGEFFLVDKKEDTSLRTFNKFEFEKSLHALEEKKKRFEELRANPLIVSDPGPEVLPAPNDVR